jgi:hypothetical protein
VSSCSLSRRTGLPTPGAHTRWLLVDVLSALNTQPNSHSHCFQPKPYSTLCSGMDSVSSESHGPQCTLGTRRSDWWSCWLEVPECRLHVTVHAGSRWANRGSPGVAFKWCGAFVRFWAPAASRRRFLCLSAVCVIHASALCGNTATAPRENSRQGLCEGKKIHVHIYMQPYAHARAHARKHTHTHIHTGTRTHTHTHTDTVARAHGMHVANRRFACA